MEEVVARAKCYIKGEERNTKKKVKDARSGHLEIPTHRNNNSQAITHFLLETR